MIPFVKYHGAGNDFVLVDQRRQTWIKPDDRQRIAGLCHRRLGVGADGLILLTEHPDYAFEMMYFNADGGLGSFCGNGGRCVVAFAASLGVFKKACRFKAADGPHDALLFDDGSVEISMRNVSHWRREADDFVLDTGSPHWVRFAPNVASLDVEREGAAVRYDPAYAPGGINANFAQERGPHEIDLRTYERGVEAETLACGTGVTAAALALSLRRGDLLGEQRIQVNALGGMLTVRFERTPDGFEHIRLRGPVQRVFEGRFG